MQIEVLGVESTTVPTAKGTYQTLNVKYNNEAGKPLSKKVVSFGAGAAAFQALIEAKQGDKFNVVEDTSSYKNWVSASKTDGTSAGYTPSNTRSAPKSNYETPEERARRQVYIVRQSSVSNAIELAKAQEPKGLAKSLDDILEDAKAIEQFVFGQEALPVDDRVE